MEQRPSGELDDFRNQIEEIKERETSTGHFAGPFDKNELTEDDLAIWQVFRDLMQDQITYAEFVKKYKDYRAGFTRESSLSSRGVFAQYIGNIAISKIEH